MKIGLLNEMSQVSKNSIIMKELRRAAERHGHEVYNVGMTAVDDMPELLYNDLGLAACILLNSGALDFVVTGCGTGQGAMISLNSYPGVYCGYMIDPSDGYLFVQINNGNAVSLPFGKGFGWAADINLQYAFENLFSCEPGTGYPPERGAMQKIWASDLRDKKEMVALSVMEVLEIVNEKSPESLKKIAGHKGFMDCLYQNSKVREITEFMRQIAENN
ncbi:MAG: RpiB/LacA/LacB family sugar-phosphate isomerase [Eubacterium sp.]|nr:RpiB/LacA/LacB family sugar-phosphate isomerase [Eubacterium sp.]